MVAPTFPAHAATGSHSVPAISTASVEKLTKIMNPAGVAPVGTHCTKALLFGLRAKTVIARIFCARTTGKQIVVWGYQFDSRKDYLAGLAHMNSFTKFSSLRPGANCPPARGKAAGRVGWHANSNPKYKARRGQFLECFRNSNNRPLLIWTMPTQHVFFMSLDSARHATIGTILGWWSTVSYG
jgi:hypothetical protein